MNEASLEQLSESLRGHESLSEVDDFNALATKYIESGETIKTLQGAAEGMVKIPGEDAPEEREAFFRTHMGVPESADKYEVDRPDAMPEGYLYDETYEKEFKEAAFAAGLSPAQVKAMKKFNQDYEIKFNSEVDKAIAEKNEANAAGLKDLWPGDAYKQNTEKALRGITAFVEKVGVPEKLGGLEGFKAWLTSSGMDTDPISNWMWSKMYEQIGGDKWIQGEHGGEVKEEDYARKLYADMKPAEN